MSDTEFLKPEVFVKSITFNDGNTIEFNKSDIVVFTGANNVVIFRIFQSNTTRSGKKLSAS